VLSAYTQKELGCMCESWGYFWSYKSKFYRLYAFGVRQTPRKES